MCPYVNAVNKFNIFFQLVFSIKKTTALHYRLHDATILENMKLSVEFTKCFEFVAVCAEMDKMYQRVCATYGRIKTNGKIRMKHAIRQQNA